MHLTLKKEATKPPGNNFLQQQEKFDYFIREFNTERPHQALDMKCHDEIYAPSPRPYKRPERLQYPFHDMTITVTHCGRICFKNHKIHLTLALADQEVGIKELDDGIWLVSFMDYDLGYFDVESELFEPVDYPFAPEIV